MTSDARMMEKGMLILEIKKLKAERDEYRAALKEMYSIHGKYERCAKCNSNAGDDHIASCKAKQVLKKYEANGQTDEKA